MSEKCVPHRVALPLEHEEPSYIYLSLFSFQKQCFCNWYRDNKIQLLAALRSAFLEELLWWVSSPRTDNILGSETRPWSNTVILIAICATFWWVTKLSALEYHHIEHVGLTAKVSSTVSIAGAESAICLCELVDLLPDQIKANEQWPFENVGREKWVSPGCITF